MSGPADLAARARGLAAVVAAKARPRLRPEPRVSLFHRGLAVHLPPGIDAGEVRATLIGRSAFVRAEPRPTPALNGSAAVAVFGLDHDRVGREREAWRLLVEIGGEASLREIELGPGLFDGAVEAVRDYRVEGWATPLFAAEGFELRLSVDAVPGPLGRPNRFRRDLLFDPAGDGWVGFSLPLPARALDGAPHALAVEAGATRLELPPWSAAPDFRVDDVRPRRVAGWFIDANMPDSPTTISVVAPGERTVASLRTSFRPDLKEAFGRDAASFAFDELPSDVEAGHELVAGSGGDGLAFARVTLDDLASRVSARRAAARARLVGGPPDGSVPDRQAIREALATERRDLGARLAVRPLVPAEPPAETAPESAGAAAAARAAPPPACAIVPVYKGLPDVRLCLDSLLPQLEPGRFRAVVIDDASPEPELSAFLATLAAESRPGLTVLANESNLGFVATVNRGFAQLGPGEDAVVVNADTVLPPRALAKLARRCHERPGVASVTPLSNNATVLSFPGADEPGPPAFGLGADELDRLVEAIGPEPVILPTGIGFCMYLNRQALEEVGVFSLDWGRGYCEEVEWSLAARDLGWIHLAAADTFVVHEGSTSFGKAGRNAILAANHARLEAIYPEYLDEVRGFLAADPLEPVRVEALVRLLAGRVRTLAVHLDHGLGGGTKRYIDDICSRPRPEDDEIAVVSPVAAETGTPVRLRLALDRAGVAITLGSERLLPLLDSLEAAGTAVTLHVSARLGYPSRVLDAIAGGPRPYLVTLHDFQWYCPQVHLTDEREFYCGEPPPAQCQLCVRHKQVPDYDFRDQNDLIQADFDAWLAFDERFLRGAAQLIAPSQDTATRYARRLGLESIAVLPHDEVAPPAALPRQPAARPSGPLRVAAVGGIGLSKGLEALIRLAEHGERERLPLFLRVIGSTADDRRLTGLSNADVTGRYDPADLRTLLDAFDPHVVLLPSVWPETYSYVLSEVWAAGRPVVAFDLGAPAERIRARGGGVLIPPTRDPAVLYAALLDARERLAGASPVEAGR